MNKAKAFEILGISEASNKAEIKTEYYSKSMELNQQLENAHEKAEWKDFLRKIKELDDAYQMLTNKKVTHDIPTKNAKHEIPKWKRVLKSLDAFLCAIEDSFVYKAILIVFKLLLALLALGAIFFLSNESSPKALFTHKCP
jgi:preprotein translocase subunit Sec63